jgi:hypothetical protein
LVVASHYNPSTNTTNQEILLAKAYCLIISIILNGLEGLYKKIGIGPEIESD